MADRQIPSPGRIIHIAHITNDGSPAPCGDYCRPAIVTGIQHISKEIFITIFAVGILPSLATMHYDNPDWHWPIIQR